MQSAPDRITYPCNESLPTATTGSLPHTICVSRELSRKYKKVHEQVSVSAAPPKLRVYTRKSVSQGTSQIPPKT